jgi:SAM-dependent methyltransferase
MHRDFKPFLSRTNGLLHGGIADGIEKERTRRHMLNKHTLLSPLNAWLLDRFAGVMDRNYGERKRSLFRALRGRVVEIGPGAGANLRYYRPGTVVIAVEPNPAMVGPLQKNAARYGISLEIRAGRGERIDLDADSVDAVVATLVLCSVDDPQGVVAEVFRILRPGGCFVFLEHVSAPANSRLRLLQDLIHKPWHWLFQGCHINRDTHSVLLRAGFSSVQMDCFHLTRPWVPFTPHIYGSAVK